MTVKTRTRPATAADFTAIFGRNPPRSVRAWALERDGETLGIAGYHVAGGVAVVFSDAKAGIPKLTIWRESMKFMRNLKIPAICVSTETSGPFLERLGWTYAGPSDAGDVYRYNPEGSDE